MHTSTHTAQHPSQEWRGAAETRAQAHTPTPRTPARSGGVPAERAHEHTHSPTPQPGVAGRSRNPSPNTHTHTAHPCQEWLGASTARTRAHTQPNTPARCGGAQPKPEPKHTHPHRAPQPGVAGCKRSAHTSTDTAQHPSQEWRGAAKTRAGAHTPKPHTPARRGGVQEEHAHQHTHTPTSQPGVAGRSRNPSPNTHTHTAHPCQEWLGASTARTRAHTQPNTPARSGGAQPKPEPKHTHPHRAPVPGVAGCKHSAHTSTHTAQHPSQEWRGAAETRAQTQTPTPHTRARCGWVQAQRAHEYTHSPTPQPGVAGRSRNPSPNTHTHNAHLSQEWLGASTARTRAHTQPNTPVRSGGAQPKPEPKHTHPHRTPVPGVAWCKRSAHTSKHTAQQPSQEWRGAAKTRAQTHTPTPHTHARSGEVQAERAHEHTHSPTPQPRVAARSRNPSPSTHTQAAHPGQKRRGTGGARTPAHTQPNTPARSGGAQPKPEPKHTHPHRTPKPGVAGRSRNPNPNTHIHGAHPSQEWRAASRAPTPAHTQPNTPARSGGAQPKPEPQHTHPHREPQPGVAGCRRSGHTSTHTAQHSSQEWRGAAETRAQTHTPPRRTPARSGGVQAERAQEHTHSPTAQPGVAGRRQNLSPSTHTQAAHPSQERRGTGGARRPAHTHPNTPARSGGAQPKPEPKNTHPHRTLQPGVAGYKGGTHTSTHTAQHPSQEWRGAAETRAQTHTPTARTRARCGLVQAERAHEHAHSPTTLPGVAMRSRNPSPNTHTHTAHPCGEWLGASGERTRAHTQPNTPARSGGAQPKPEPKHKHPDRAPQPGSAGCKRSAHTSTDTAQHPSQEWRGAAETRAQTHTPKPHTPARRGGVQEEHAHQHTHSPTPQPGVAGRIQNPSQNTHTHTAHPSQEWTGTRGAHTRAHTQPKTPARSGGAQPKPEPKHTHPHRAPQPGVVGCKQSADTSTHTAQHPSQKWRGAAETRAQTHTPTPRTPTRSGGVQAESAHEHTHRPTLQPGVAGCKRRAHTSTHTGQHSSQERRGAAETRVQTHTPTPGTPARSGGVQAERAHEQTLSPTAQPGVAGRSRNTSPSTHTQAAHPSQERRGTGGARTPAHTHPNTPARSGGAQPKPEPKHTHPHRTLQPGVAGYKGGTHTSTHTAQHPSQEWRGAAQTQAQRHTPTARTPARSGGVQAERPHQHTHSPTPQPGVAGCSRNPSPNTHTHSGHPSQEWRGASGAPTPAHTQPNTPARSGGAQPKPEPKHTHPRRAPQPGVAGCKRSAHTSTHTA